MDNNRWWDDAACVTEDFKALARKAGATKSPADVFFPITQTDDGRTIRKMPEKYASRQARFMQLAKRTCGDCPVRRECLLDACQTDAEPPFGFTGALAPEQRVDLMSGAELVSTPCPGCSVTLWGTKKYPPSKTCGGNCGK